MAGFGTLLAGHVPACIVILVGYGLLIAEMYMPGFGVAGISGTALVIGGIALMQPTAAQALLLVVISVVILGAALFFAMRSLKKGRLNRTGVVLNDELDAGETRDLSALEGMMGTAHTAVRPSGIAMLGGEKVNAVSDGDFIPAGARVRVERVDGKRVVVRESK